MTKRRIEPPNRPDLYVVARFLDRLRERDTTWSRSRLQHAVRLNYDLFRSYLVLLKQKGFVEEVDASGGPDRSPGLQPSPSVMDAPVDQHRDSKKSRPDRPEDSAQGEEDRKTRRRTVIRLTAEGRQAHDRLVAWIRDVFDITRL